MSLAQVSALTLYDGAPEFMKRAQYIGLQTTNSASSARGMLNTYRHNLMAVS